MREPEGTKDALERPSPMMALHDKNADKDADTLADGRS